MAHASVADLLTSDHRRCDDQLAAFETVARKGRWPDAAAALAAFELSLRGHLDAEERILFPAFEQATGQRSGPTVVMRMEHEQMRSLLGTLAAAVARADARGCLDSSDTLMLLIQQHNMKEEQMLYPMCDQVLGGTAGEVVQQLAAALPAHR